MRNHPALAVGVGLSTIALDTISAAGTPASAAAAAASPPTQVRATTSPEILYLSALDIPGVTTLAESSVGAATGSVTGSGDPRTSAGATNLRLALADQDLGAILASQSQSPTAPADNPEPATQRSGDGSVPGVLGLGVSTV